MSEELDLTRVLSQGIASDFVSEAFALEHQIWVFKVDEKGAHIARSKKTPEDILYRLQQVMGYEKSILLYWADAHELSERLLAEYAGRAHFLMPLNEVSEAYNAVDVLDELLKEALQKNASDIHFEPKVQWVNVRYRIDGVMRCAHVIECEAWSALLVRLKVLSDMDVTEQRLPQDGRFQWQRSFTQLDCRVSVMPVASGESAVVRLLRMRQQQLSIEHLNLTDDLADQLRALAQLSSGLILMCGPTGSGKTTTLCALIQSMDVEERVIATLEDPIEYDLEGVRQTSINEALGFGFYEGVRALLRQDLDVLLIGEIRDEKTAAAAIRAAMTGHLVVATVHADSARQVWLRLLDLGLTERMLSEALVGVLNQRLLRVLNELGEYQGRAPLLEWVSLESIQKPSTLLDQAKTWVANGKTSLEEVKRVLGG